MISQKSIIPDQVTGGPPPSPLPEFSVQILNNNVYVSSARVN